MCSQLPVQNAEPYTRLEGCPGGVLDKDSMINILRNPSMEKLSIKSVVFPLGGEVYVFKKSSLPHPDDAKCDGYVWQQTKLSRCPDENPVLERRYYAVVVERKKCFAFRRVIANLVDAGHEYVLVQYIGDATVYQGHTHGNSKSSNKQFVPESKSVKEKITNAGEFQPKKIYNDLVLEGQKNDDSVIYTPRDPKKVINVAHQQRQELRLTHDALYNLFVLAKDIPHFITNLKIHPDVSLYLIYTPLIDTLHDVLVYSKKSNPTYLSYDTTFQLGDFFVSVLSFRHCLFEGSPSIPIAYHVHERKFREDHELFIKKFVSLLKPKNLKVKIALVTDREFSVQHILPDWMQQVYCWNHIRRNARDFVRYRANGKKAESDALSSVAFDLLKCRSLDEYELLKEVEARKWSEVYKEYFQRCIDDVIKANSARWILEDLGIYDPVSGITSNCAESVNSMIKRLLLWKERPMDVFVLCIYELTRFYEGEVKRGLHGTGSCLLRAGYSAIPLSEMPPMKPTIHPSEIIDSMKKSQQQRPVPGYAGYAGVPPSMPPPGSVSGNPGTAGVPPSMPPPGSVSGNPGTAGVPPSMPPPGSVSGNPGTAGVPPSMPPPGSVSGNPGTAGVPPSMPPPGSVSGNPGTAGVPPSMPPPGSVSGNPGTAGVPPSMPPPGSVSGNPGTAGVTPSMLAPDESISSTWLARRVIDEKRISLVAEQQAFLVEGSDGRKYAVTLYPQTCSCPATSTCYHIEAALMAIGASCGSKKRKNVCLTLLNKRAKKSVDRRSGSKKSHLNDVTIVAAPDSQEAEDGVTVTCIPVKATKSNFQADCVTALESSAVKSTSGSQINDLRPDMTPPSSESQNYIVPAAVEIPPGEQSSGMKLLRWGPDGLEGTTNSCAIDNMLSLSYLSYRDSSSFAECLRRGQSSAEKNLLLVMQLMEAGNFAGAKGFWVDFLELSREFPKTSNGDLNLWGGESELFLEWLIPTFSIAADDACTNIDTCPKSYKQFKIGIICPNLMEDLQTQLDNLTAQHTISCTESMVATPQNRGNITKYSYTNEDGKEVRRTKCNGDRFIIDFAFENKNVFFLPLNLYHHKWEIGGAISNLPPEITLLGRVFRLKGFTANTGAHFVSYLYIKEKFCFYDGMMHGGVIQELPMAGDCEGLANVAFYAVQK